MLESTHSCFWSVATNSVHLSGDMLYAWGYNMRETGALRLFLSSHQTAQ